MKAAFEIATDCGATPVISLRDAQKNAPEFSYIEHHRAPTSSGTRWLSINIDLCQFPSVPELFEFLALRRGLRR
jgi:hypothetical protein